MRTKAIPAYPRARRPAANLAFSALLLTFLGWAILERWILAAHAGAMPHLISSLACAPVLACALRRFHAVCPRHQRISARPTGVAATRALVLTLLCAVGALFGIAACTGSMVLVAVPAALCCVTPWTVLRAHQQHLFLSFVALTAGAALAPALAGMPLNLMAAMSAAWCLWALAAGLCIVLCGSELSKARRR
jgi:cbb3-type cytochrome oxidase subunit 1